MRMDNYGMTPSSPDPESLNAFSKLYAVVLHHQVGSGFHVRWSPQHTAWLRSLNYSGYWADSPGEVYGRADAPTEEDFAAALALVRQVTRGAWICQRCLQPDPCLHFIAPNVYGEPELYCVQMPSCSVVESQGGQGEVKHWGSPFGCQSVKVAFDVGEPSNRIGLLAAYVYGRPLPAEEVIRRRWCSRCVGAAYNVRSNAGERGESQLEWARKQVQMDVRGLRRALADYYGEH
jgi:hypothetical protein